MVTAARPSLAGLPQGMLLMRTVATSICGSDFWGATAACCGSGGWRGVLDYFFVRQGCVGGSGHEVLAEVVDAVQPSTRQPGELLLAMTTGYLHWVASAGAAFETRTGHAVKDLPKNGSFSEYFLSYDAITFAVPRAVPRAGFNRLHYILAQPLGTVLHAVDRAVSVLQQPLHSLRIAVIGQGQNGLLLTHALARSGCTTIVAVDRLNVRLKAARRAGATAVRQVQRHSTPQQLRQDIADVAPDGVDVAFEMVGHQGASLDFAAACTRDDGHVVIFGLPASDVDRKNASVVRFVDWARNLRYISAHAPPLAAFERAMRMLRDGVLDPTFVFTHEYPFERFPEAYRAASNYSDGVLKTLVTFPHSSRFAGSSSAKL